MIKSFWEEIRKEKIGNNKGKMSTWRIYMLGSIRVHKHSRHPCMPEYSSESWTLHLCVCICICFCSDILYFIWCKILNIVPCGHISSLFSIFIPSYFILKRHYHPLHHQQSYDRLSPSPQHHVWLHPPYTLLFTPYSPVMCKDFFPLVYMYKSSRYYTVFHINLGPMFPQSTSI